MYKFPADFIWGTSTSAHQTEGNNTNSDWWYYEHNKTPGNPYPKEPSGIATDSYNRYEEDFDLCVQLNNGAVRISVEWARLEPEEGKFAQQEFEHYKKVLTAAKSRKLKTFVTLHHFTNPKWFADMGQWERGDAHKYFARYAKKCAEEFGPLIDFYTTINEPQVYSYGGYIKGFWPPFKKNVFKALLVQANLIKGHNKAYDAIKTVSERFQVGLVKNIMWIETDPFGSHWYDRLYCKLFNLIIRDGFLHFVLKQMDFLGINYYFTRRIINLKEQNPNDYLNDLGWWINPIGLEHILVELKKHKIPMYVTENGLADAEDKYRTHFIEDHLIACAAARDKGADLRGYFYWSLIDNFEWHEGFWPRFGLVEIDRSPGENGQPKLTRKPRPSFSYYAEISKTGILENYHHTPLIHKIT